jgi:carboxyl-terminal processing protease
MRRGFVSIAAALVIMAVMASSFLTGVKFGSQQSQRYVIDGTPVPTAVQQPLYDLWQGYERLKSDSFWRPFSDQQIADGLYQSTNALLMATTPKDGHTAFVPPAQNTVVTGVLNETGQYGIGATVVQVPNGLEITPRVGSPAQNAGLRAGDVITHVDGRDIRHMNVQTAVDLIHGTLGAPVTLTIVRPGVARPFDVKVVRGVIPSVASAIVGSTGVISFQGFDADTATEFHKNLQYLESQHVTGLVVDLRGNLGGYVDVATGIASEFLPRGDVIFWERTNVGNGKTADTATRVDKPGIAQRLPVVVLTDGNTASAAEIFTAALRENGRAIVVGTQTYGKGSEQENVALPDGSALRITTHLWLTPRKHWVQQQPIQPDIQVAAAITADGQDAQLQRAVQYLQRRR